MSDEIRVAPAGPTRLFKFVVIAVIAVILGIFAWKNGCLPEPSSGETSIPKIDR